MRKRTEKNGKPPSKLWLSPSSRYARTRLLLAGIAYPKHRFAGSRIRVRGYLLSSGRSCVEEKEVCPLSLNWELALVWSPARLLQRGGFFGGCSLYASSDPPWKQGGFLALEKIACGFLPGNFCSCPCGGKFSPCPPLLQSPRCLFFFCLKTP